MITRAAAAFIFGILRYRQKVIRKNLEIAFSDQPPAERLKIYKAFVKGFSEIFAEMIQVFSMSRKDFQKRMKFQIPKELEKALAEDQDIFIAGAHINQWEWAAIAAGIQFPRRVAGIYKPLSSRPMNAIMLRLRQRMGTHMIPMGQVVRDLLRKDREKTIYLFLADQSTPFVDKAHWVDFFGHSTPFLPGMSVLAYKRNIPIFYFYIKRLRRGYYQTQFETLKNVQNPDKAETITELYAKKVEENILKDPPAWLWTHKRWKRVLPY